MKKKEKSSGGVRLLAVLALIAGTMVITGGMAHADGSLIWNEKNGATACDAGTTGTVLWIFNPHSDAVPTALYINGQQVSGSWTQSGGGQNWHFTASIPGTFADIDTASLTYSGTLGNNPVFTISGCNEGNLPPAADLTITKTAAGTYDRECTWKITKDVDRKYAEAPPGGSATFNYTVGLSGSCDTIKNVEVTGKIKVTNPNDGAVEIDSLTDELSDGTACDITQTTTTIPANDFVEYDYTCDLSAYANEDGTPPPTDLVNTVTVSWLHQVLSDGSELAAGTTFADKDVTFTENLIDDCATVTDTNSNGPQGVEICSDDLVNGAYSWKYAVTFNATTIGSCQEYTNTASFVDNSEPQHDGSASQTVKVCTFRAPLTIGYWKTHMHLCAKGEKSTDKGCSSSAPFTKQYLGQSICDGCATVGVLGTYNATTEAAALAVFNANNCSNASTSDANAANCLAAQLLAAQLNVANGANTCICDTIKAASALLTAVKYAGPTVKVTFTGSGYTRANAIALKTALDNYNNGKGCPA